MVSFGNPVTQPSCLTTSFIRFSGTPGSPMVWLILYPQMVPFLAKLLLLTQNWQLLISRDLFRKLKFSWKFEFFREINVIFCSTFQWLWKAVGQNLQKYTGFPKLVGECGGKNYHFVHTSADVESVVKSTVRSAFEYQGQKCSACSRMYVPESLWPQVNTQIFSQNSTLGLRKLRVNWAKLPFCLLDVGCHLGMPACDWSKFWPKPAWVQTESESHLWLAFWTLQCSALKSFLYFEFWVC